MKVNRHVHVMDIQPSVTPLLYIHVYTKTYRAINRLLYSALKKC